MALSSSRNILRRTVIAQSVALAITALAASHVVAAPAPCGVDNGNGLITLSGYQSATCVLSTNNSLNITSTGEANGGVQAISQFVGTITNGGIISNSLALIGAQTSAINNLNGGLIDNVQISGSAIYNGVTNAGHITGDFYITSSSEITGDVLNAATGVIDGGISIQNNSTVSGVLQNDGTASYLSVANGVLVHGIANTGTVGDIYVTSATVNGAITNSGSVDGQIYVGTGGSVSGGITNSGTVGRIYISDSTIANGITNSGTVGYVAATNNSVITGGISNTGTISGSSQALYLYGSSVSGGITNHAGATISSSDYAVYISSDSNVTGGINNAGLISAPGTLSGGNYYSGVGELISGHVDSIGNTGVISANETGIRLSSSAVISGTISNSGTISGNSFAIDISDSAIIAGGIINTGLLDGQVYLGQSTLNLNGTAGRVTGSISGHGATVNVNGTFTMENTIDVGMLNIAQGGALNMGAGNGQVSNYYINSILPVTNSGTLIVNPGVDNEIYGDYSQTATGVFQSNVSGIAQYGKLIVNGTADLTQGSIKINTSTPSLMLMDGAVDTILSATTLNFNPNIAVTDTSLLFDFQTTQIGNDIQLKTVASSNSGNTATGSVNNQGNSAGRGAASVIDQMIGQGNAAPAAFLPVINTLGTLDSQKKVSDAISETLPLMTAGMTQSTLNTLHGTNQVIQSRQEANLGRSSGDEFLGDRQFWFKPLGSWAKQNDRNGVAGYDADTYGMVFGVDGTLSDKSSIGGAFAYTSTKVDSNSDVAKQHADVDGYQLAVYGAYKLDNNTSITYQGDIGNNQVSGDRRIAFMGTTANSDFSSWSAHVGAGIGKTMDLSERTTFTPSVRFDYTRLRTDGYTEKGAGPLNLRVDGDTVEELILGVDAAFSHTLSTNASLVGNLGVGYDTMNEQSSVTSSYVGGGAAFATKGIDPSPWVMRGGLGVVMHNGPLVSVTARYDLEARESFTNQTASVKVGIKF